MGFRDPENARKADVAGSVINVMLQDPEIYKSKWYFECFNDNNAREFHIEDYDLQNNESRKSLRTYMRQLEDILDGFIFKDKKPGFTKYKDAVSIMKMIAVHEAPRKPESIINANSPN